LSRLPPTYQYRGSPDGDGGNGQGGGPYGGGTVPLTGSRITGDQAEAGMGGTDGQGVGSTVRVHRARITHNHASTSDDKVFGDLNHF
jgi:hypothetical protein